MSVKDAIEESIEQLRQGDEDEQVQSLISLTHYLEAVIAREQMDLGYAIAKLIIELDGIQLIMDKLKSGSSSSSSSSSNSSSKEDAETSNLAFIYYAYIVLGYILLFEIPDVTLLFSKEDTIHTVLSNMEQVINNPKTVAASIFAVLKVVWYISTMDQHVDNLANSKLLEMFIQLLKSHLDDIQIVYTCIGVLADLSFHAIFEIKIGQSSDAFPQIIAALMAHKSEERVLAKGMQLLGNTSNILQNQYDIGDLDGVTFFVECAKEYADNPDLFERILWVLRNFSRTDRFMEQIGELSEILVLSLHKFEDVESLIEVLVHVIANLVHNEKNKSIMRELKADDGLLDILTHYSNKHITKQVMRALEQIKELSTE